MVYWGEIMDLNQLSAVLNTVYLARAVFKVLAIFFSVFYLFYAIILFKQTEVMNKTLETSGRKIIFIVSLVQVLVGMVILIFAIFLS